MAQRQRAGLITLRSHDRDVSPVFYISVGLQNLLVNASDAKQASLTGVAKRKRDGLITRRSQDRNLSPVFYISVGLQNLLVNRL